MAEKAKCGICDKDFPNEDALAMHNSAKHSVQKIEKKSNSKIFFLILFIIMIIGGYFLINGNLTGNAIENNIQKITLSMKNYNYYPDTIKVKSGIPVEITLDNSVKGCYRSFNIKGLGVSKYSSAPVDTITFTPDKKGNFEFACGMRMGTGTIIVE